MTAVAGASTSSWAESSTAVENELVATGAGENSRQSRRAPSTSGAGRTSVRAPKLSVTTSERTRYTAPTGSSTGTTNQSLP